MNIKRYLAVIIISIAIGTVLIGCSRSTTDSDSFNKTDNNIEGSILKSEGNKGKEFTFKNENDKELKIDDEDETEEDIEIEKKRIELSVKAQREINLFLSNFTEVFFLDFKGEPSNKMLINFGVRHNDINNFDAIKVEGYHGFLDKSVVERSIYRFFDLDIKHQKTETYDFDGTNYIIRLASGAPVHMAVVQEMHDNNDGTYTVYFDEVFSNEFLDYSLNPKELEEEIKNNPDRTEIVAFKKAIVERHNFEQKSIYKLLEYVTVDNR